MATKVRYKLTGLLWITTLFCIVVLVQGRPQTETSFIEAGADPSDRTLIRVLRSEFDEEEEGQTSLKARKPRKVEQHFPPLKKRASQEEDQFFQALLSRAQDKPVEKRSYEAQPEKDDVGMNWKGDSKISDADKKELEHLFNSIGMVEEEQSSRGKLESKRSTGNDGKVHDLVEWLMSKPPKEFHESLRHIIDVEHQVSDIFAADDTTTPSATTSETVVNEPETTSTETVSSSTTSSDSSSVSPPVAEQTSTSSPVAGSFASLPGQSIAGSSEPAVSVVTQPANTVASQPAVSGVTQPAAISQPAVSGVAQPARAGPQSLANDMPQSTQNAPQAPGKKPNVYADVMKASKMLAQTGPGPIPIEAMNYFNKFGGVGNQLSQATTGYGVHPQLAVPAVQQAPAIQPQQGPAVPQPVAGQPQQNVQQYNPQQQHQVQQQQQQQQSYQQQQQQYNQQKAAYQYQQDQRRQNYYYDHMYRPPRPYVSRNGNYHPPTPRPYPLHKDELDKPTGKKKSVTASILFKQNWSADFEKKRSTRYRVFKTEAKRQLERTFEAKKNFKSVTIDKLREDRGKVAVTFTIHFKKKTETPLKPLYEQIVRDALGKMPVYRDTLVRGDKQPQMAPVRTATKMEKSQSENPATEFAQFADQVDRELTGENLPLNEKHEAYQGCYKDRKPHRDMKRHFSKFEMTPEWCLHTCKKEGYRFAGVQYSYLCFCGNKFGKYGRVPDSECSSRCYGDKHRFCGSFWHNSIYSVDGQHHNVDEFSALPDDDEEDDDDHDESKDKHEDEDKNDDKSEKDDEKEHAEVANHLMKAASSALKAAKKLLPSGKDKRQISSEDLVKDKEEAKKALKAVDEIVEEKSVDKRSAENADGRNLLMAYLGNVGGYDREYRSAEDENKPVEKLKFEYKREIIDEEGDGEFVSKPKDGKKLKRSRRSLESEDFDGRKKMASRAMAEDSSDATNPKSAFAEPSRRELLTKDMSDKEVSRHSRDVDDEEEEKEDREMLRRRKSRKTEKRSVAFEKSLYHDKVQEGIENIIGGVIDVMKASTSIGSFKEDIEKLATDVSNGLAIPPEQKDQVTSEIRKDIKDTGTSSVNNLITSIRTELTEYGEMHPAVGPQAEEAAHTFSDLPLDANKAEEIKTKIRKRSVDANDEKEQEFLSDILKEHFKLNP